MFSATSLTSGVVLLLSGCASSAAPSRKSAEMAPSSSCGNAALHEQFERELAAAQAEPDAEMRAAAVCRVAHDWGLDDCSNVTPASLNLP